ncbi:MAG: methyltransferase domain-containing protein [Frateuria sp.]|nr:methyltransferase domain-containing protein [Frateuria sp.]
MLESFQRRSLPSHQPEQLHHDLDAVNRSTWQRRSTVNQYRKLTGWTDPGERAAVEWARPFIQGHPILDIGVGAGRTTPLLRSLGSDYLGIDYTPEMVEACRGRHPDSHFAHMDARNLQSLPANHYGLVVFSFNGIDSVAPADRPTILAEVHRVLRPGGLFIVSSHNREGPGARERPGLNVVFTPNPLRLVWRVLRSLGALPRAMRNHRRLLAANEDHDECAVRNAGAHDFGLLVVYTTLAEQQRQLAAAGFEVPVAFDSERGESVTAAQETHDIRWFHCVARKRVTA